MQQFDAFANPFPEVAAGSRSLSASKATCFREIWILSSSRRSNLRVPANLPIVSIRK